MRNVSEKIVEKIKTHILCAVTFVRKSYCLWEGCGTTGQDKDDNIMGHRKFAIFLSETKARIQTCTHI
jgi:hypothetical protein